MYTFVFGIARYPLGGADLVSGQAGVIAGSADAGDQFGALAGQLAQQEAPPATGHVNVFATDSVQQRRSGFADVEWRADLFTGLLGNAADLDHNGTGIDLEPVDVVRGGASADLVEAFDNEGPIATVRKPSGGEQPARAGADNNRIELC